MISQQSYLEEYYKGNMMNELGIRSWWIYYNGDMVNEDGLMISESDVNDNSIIEIWLMISERILGKYPKELR